jgi:hypothetical protein
MAESSDTPWIPHPASFRDHSGFLFWRGEELLRQVNADFQAEYELLHNSGLYEELVADGLLVAHEEVDPGLAATDDAIRVIRPERLPFISHPLEWCFSQLRAAAQLTIEVQTRAIGRGMTLRDATAYNVQFVGSRPVWIDTLSFGRYTEGSPWAAYGQFCAHFLAPLRVSSDVSPELRAMGIRHLNGFPLSLASRLLSPRSWLRFSDLFHIHLHARSVERHAGESDPNRIRKATLSSRGMRNLVESLGDAVSSIRPPRERTHWARYEEEHGYGALGLESKRRLVEDLTSSLDPSLVWDLGSNAGMFSAPLAARGRTVVSMDLDHGAVELAFRRSREVGSEAWLPLWLDLLSPTPSHGWATRERQSMEDRGPADLVLVLALIHHLALTGNIALDPMARWLARISRSLLIEWVPADDPQARRLTVARGGPPPEYTIERFRSAFGGQFEVVREERVAETDRILFLLRSRQTGRSLG